MGSKKPASPYSNSWESMIGCYHGNVPSVESTVHTTCANSTTGPNGPRLVLAQAYLYIRHIPVGVYRTTGVVCRTKWVVMTLAGPGVRVMVLSVKNLIWPVESSEFLRRRNSGKHILLAIGAGCRSAGCLLTQRYASYFSTGKKRDYRITDFSFCVGSRFLSFPTGT